jgi:hypothetical protein
MLIDVIFGKSITRSLLIKVTWLGHETDGGFNSDVLSLAAPQNPVDDAHVLPKSGPQELVLLVRAEPVYMEDPGQLSQFNSIQFKSIQFNVFVTILDTSKNDGICLWQ